MTPRMRSRPHIGIDLDNTIVCYDGVFHDMAMEYGVIPSTLLATKEAVHDHLCHNGMEDVWTVLQGEAYGPRMAAAPAFPGFRGFVAACERFNAAVFIVSHRTAVPLEGPAHDLHAAARQWLAAARLFETIRTEHVYLETTRQAKLRRISALDLDYFIDDQTAILLDPDFSHRTIAVHFDPHGNRTPAHHVRRAASWDDIQRLVFEVAQ